MKLFGSRPSIVRDKIIAKQKNRFKLGSQKERCFSSTLTKESINQTIMVKT